MELKKVLLFTGKFPGFGKDTDGGSILIYSLIQALKDNCILDIVFTRTPCSKFETIEGIRNISFETYRYRQDNKFMRRLANKEQLYLRLEREISKYDVVVITHCSKAFGIENLMEEEKKKIILFPMYLSSAYRRSGEIPPEQYVEEERNALQSVGKILTPSESERQDMIHILGVNEEKIKILPRGYSANIKPWIKSVTYPVKLLYIASVKEQKNTKEAVILLKELLEKGIDAVLHLTGSCQNVGILAECKEYIAKNSLTDKVIFHGVLTQKELAVLIGQVHINISVSHWETYGRGIFEGMAGGLPTIVFEHLECVKQYVTDGEGISFVSTHEEFLLKLIKLCNDKEFYRIQAKKAIQSVEHLSEIHEKEKLIKELI